MKLTKMPMKVGAVVAAISMAAGSVLAARAPAAYSDSDPGTIDTRVCAAPLASANDFESRTHTRANSDPGEISTMPVSVVISFR